MASLKIGDRVSDLTGAREGRLVDLDGATAYVLQSNGVELEFPLDRLKPYEPAKPAIARTLQGPLRDLQLTPAQQAFLASIPPDVTAAITRSYEAGHDPDTPRPAYAALPDSKKLEVIRIHLPALPQRLLMANQRLVAAIRKMPRVN